MIPTKKQFEEAALACFQSAISGSGPKYESSRYSMDNGNWFLASFQNFSGNPLDYDDLTNVDMTYGYYDAMLEKFIHVDKHLDNHHDGRVHIQWQNQKMFIDLPMISSLVQASSPELDELRNILINEHKIASHKSAQYSKQS